MSCGENAGGFEKLRDEARARWPDEVRAAVSPDRSAFFLECGPDRVSAVCSWLFNELDYSFASLVVEEEPPGWYIRYLFYGDREREWVHVRVRSAGNVLPSLSPAVHALDWHEREAEDLFGLVFKGHPRLGDFVLHETWPEGVNPMRREFDPAHPYPHRVPDPAWRPLRVVQAPGSFLMPVGPIYSGVAEAAQFFLETVGEDVIRALPRLFYKYRGIEKLAEGRPLEEALLLAERFSGTTAFAHSLAFCLAAEQACRASLPPRAQALRVLLAEGERLRHHVGVIGDICESTGLAVAASQAEILEEDLLRGSCLLTGHRYLYGLNVPGGLSRDLPDGQCLDFLNVAETVRTELRTLSGMLGRSSSFLDRLEEVGIVSGKDARDFGLAGPVARASGIARDLRRLQPYCTYEPLEFSVPEEEEGDGYARLRVFFAEAEESVRILRQVACHLPGGPVSLPLETQEGTALGAVESPNGAAFHWLRLGADGVVQRYRVTTPSFANWHGLHLAAEDFAFQDFPIILASFGLSVAECDR